VIFLFMALLLTDEPTDPCLSDDHTTIHPQGHPLVVSELIRLWRHRSVLARPEVGEGPLGLEDLVPQQQQGRRGSRLLAVSGASPQDVQPARRGSESQGGYEVHEMPIARLDSISSGASSGHEPPPQQERGQSTGTKVNSTPALEQRRRGSNAVEPHNFRLGGSILGQLLRSRLDRCQTRVFGLSPLHVLGVSGVL